MFPTPAVLALDVEQLFCEVGSFHVSSPVRLDCKCSIERKEHARSVDLDWARNAPRSLAGFEQGEAQPIQFSRHVALNIPNRHSDHAVAARLEPCLADA